MTAGALPVPYGSMQIDRQIIMWPRKPGYPPPGRFPVRALHGLPAFAARESRWSEATIPLTADVRNGVAYRRNACNIAASVEFRPAAFYQLDAVEDIVEFQPENHKIWVADHLIAEYGLCRAERRRGENALVLFAPECCERLGIAHDGGGHLSGRNCYEQSIYGLASDLGNVLSPARWHPRKSESSLVLLSTFLDVPV